MTYEELLATLPKKKKGKKQDEAKLQKSVVKMHRYYFPEDWQIITNENGDNIEVSVFYSNYNNATNAHGGMAGAAQGRKSGVSDLTWIRPKTNVLYIELKTQTGRQSKAQKLFQKMVEWAGQEYIICRSINEVEAIFKAEMERRKNISGLANNQNNYLHL
jgi:hypothetical protein